MRILGIVLPLVVLVFLGPQILHAAEGTRPAEAARTDIEFLLNLAQSGKVEAQLLLGEFYYERQEYSMALPWLQMAAKQGEVEAQHRLAQMYESGQGVPRDEEKAKFWLRCATDQGDPLAVYKEGFSYATSPGIP